MATWCRSLGPPIHEQNTHARLLRLPRPHAHRNTQAGAKYHIRRPGTDDEEIVPVRPKRPAAAGGVATAPILAA